jgi:hypothetical protein
MMPPVQTSLFHPVTLEPALPPYQRRSRTSRKAAQAVAPKVPTHLMRVLAYIAAHEGCTDAEIIPAFAAPETWDGLPRMSENSPRARRVGLLKKYGYIEPCGETEERYPKTMWRITKAGRAALAEGRAGA